VKQLKNNKEKDQYFSWTAWTGRWRH